MASSRRPRLTFPPGLGAIADGWDEDEQPTIAHPSRRPTSPAPAEPSDEAPGDPSLSIELADVDDREQVTAVPEIPEDGYARFVQGLGATDAAEEAPPPPTFFRVGSAGDEDGLELDLSKEAFSLEPSLRPSELPTAPPPVDIDRERIETLPQRPPIPSSLGSRDFFAPSSRDHSDVATDPPPAPFSFHSDPFEFSGRFSSAAPDVSSNGQAMKDRFAMGDFSGALALAEAILRLHPSDIEAESLANKCREVLHDMYTSRISDMSRVPQVCMSTDQIRWLSLDHRAGFLLSMIDGRSSVDDLLDVSGMQRLDALRIICSLLDQKVISLR